MERNKKIITVENLKEEFSKANSIFVVHYQGLTVREMESFRREIRQSTRIFVSKNTLTRIAVIGTDFEQLNEFFSGPIALLFSVDPINSCKVLTEYSKLNNKLKILAGIIGKDKVNSDEIKALAKLPSLDILRGQILSVFSRTASNLTNLMMNKATSICTVVEEYSKKNN